MADYTQDNIPNKLFAGDTISFGFTGVPMEMSLNPGKYKIECWGSQGGMSSTNTGGKGGRTVGVLDIRSKQSLFFYVGEAGGSQSTQIASLLPETFNGGGAAAGFQGQASCRGGGATDVRLIGGSWSDLTSLRSRLMVAAGGGGSYTGGSASNSRPGGAAGGLIGSDSQSHGSISLAKGGTQTAGGIAYNDSSTGATAGAFGRGGSGPVGGQPIGGGGGSGYYGGGGGMHKSGYGASSGAGGSSFISGHPGCDAIDDAGAHTGQPIHYSGLSFTETEMTAGVREGHGLIVLTVIELSFRCLVEVNDVIHYFDGDDWQLLGKTEEELTNDDFINYGMFPGNIGLSQEILSRLGDHVNILVQNVEPDLYLSVIPFDQIVRPIQSIDLSLAFVVKKVTADDIGEIYRLFSIDDGATWETFIEGVRTPITLTGNDDTDIPLIRDNGLTATALDAITPEMWGTVLPPEMENKKLMFIMVLSGNAVTRSISILQDRYGHYNLIRPTDYDVSQYLESIQVKFNRDIVEARIVYFR
jgi:hypothetical protein